MAAALAGLEPGSDAACVARSNLTAFARFLGADSAEDMLRQLAAMKDPAELEDRLARFKRSQFRSGRTRGTVMNRVCAVRRAARKLHEAGLTELDLSARRVATPPAARAGVDLVEIREPGEPYRVRGRDKGPLVGKRYDIIKALIDVYPDGLSLPELRTVTGCKGPNVLLERMCKADRDLKSVVRFPRESGKGTYRIAEPPSKKPSRSAGLTAGRRKV
jgi:hypothetical protein